MRSISDGHAYELANLGEGVQTIQFIEKASDTDKDPAEGALKTVTDGTTNEEVLEMMIDRLSFLQSALPDGRTARALKLIREARNELKSRTQERKAAGKLGTSLPL